MRSRNYVLNHIAVAFCGDHLHLVVWLAPFRPCVFGSRRVNCYHSNIQCRRRAEVCHAQREMTRHTVLLIDDEPQFLTLMARALRQDYTVLTAEDGLEGYALLCQYKPDIVLLDVMMPMIDGWTVLRKIRSNQALKRVRVIVVTGIGRVFCQSLA